MCKFELNRSSKLQNINDRKNTHVAPCPRSHKVVCFQMLDFETSSSTCKSEVSKPNSWKCCFSRKLHYFRGSCLSQCFYTINLSPLLVIKKGFLIIIILYNYQQCPLPILYSNYLVMSMTINVMSMTLVGTFVINYYFSFFFRYRTSP